MVMCFRFSRRNGFYCSYSALLQYKNSYRQYVHETQLVCSNKTLFIKVSSVPNLFHGLYSLPPSSWEYILVWNCSSPISFPNIGSLFLLQNSDFVVKKGSKLNCSMKFLSFSNSDCCNVIVNFIRVLSWPVLYLKNCFN